ncbi:hypothetical protein LCI18_006182 [Fusarium solani-melongenae]|uniref:Uncharacterized protein n=1 Tax=Fusarium solani subsp. cucurbitae TaxID=2747967 RepID=A0ACD3Z218_FUSSC|nr:hypothetical protein LCI18_006182 [Fusarium solani-melongenae]
MAHRDIKPSNILIYETPSSEGNLILKLTDFGLSIDLSKALTWEHGSRALQSAWQYDSPESRRASPSVGIKSPILEKIHIPSATDLLANDIWKLGSVFTEMVAFLVCGGSMGVVDFRDHITTTEGKISSDMFNDTRFDDSEKVKDQVDFPNIRYDDGLRIATFIPASYTNPLSRTERLQLGIEERIKRQVDWWPFPRPRPRLRPDQFLMTWEGIELCMSLSQNELDRYKPMCLPRTTRNTPILPVANQPAGSSTQRSTNIPLSNISQPGGTNSQHAPGNVALGGAVQSSTTQQSSGLSRDIYWCIEKIFTEPTENHLFSIPNSEDLKDDKELYDQVNKAISSARCWIWRLFSWKRCTEVEFLEFCVVRRDDSEVDPMKTGLLPLVAARDYTHAVPPPHDVQMRAARKQMVLGLMYPSKGKGKKTIISMLPKKLNPPPLLREMGQVGWGLHAKMGFSQWRFPYWLIFCFVFNIVFVVLWLVYISPTDLQNAFVPTFIATVAVTIGLGVVQISELRDTK